MLSERLLSNIVKVMNSHYLDMKPAQGKLPGPNPGQRYMLYAHVPFCERLCPYCSFNRFPFQEDKARAYFDNLRTEMRMLADMGYNFDSMYVGGGTPTILMDELAETIRQARYLFDIQEVSSETNPNHLIPSHLEQLQGMVQRLSVGVQSFDNGLLKQMDRYKKYGSGEEIFERIQAAKSHFDLINVDMIFNFPSQTEEILRSDLEKIRACGAQQTTFSPLYVSHGTQQKMAQTLGKLDYPREYEFYKIIDETLAGGENPDFHRSTLWTFTRKDANTDASAPQIEEYQTNYDDYPAIGSGSITHLAGALYVNHFSIADYNAAIESGKMSIMGKAAMSKRSLMRYSFLVNLYKLRLDKRAFKREFGCSVEAGLPAEMAFMALNGAFATNNADELTLTPRGRYLVVVMYRKFLSGMNNLREQARACLSGAERQILFEDSEDVL